MEAEAVYLIEDHQRDFVSRSEEQKAEDRDFLCLVKE